MNILILGAGRVGESVAESLASEQNDITVVDTDPARLAVLQDRLDIKGVAGNGIQPSVLRDAGIEDADLFIACAPLDETNLVACKVARQLFNVPTTIARIRSPEFQHDSELTTDRHGFAVDEVICPEESVTRTIRKLIEYPEALQVLEFADGLLSLVAVRAVAGGPLVQHSLAEIPQLVPGAQMRIVAIYRQESVLQDLTGTTRIEPGDEVFVLAATDQLRQVLGALRKMDRPVRRIMVAGGGKVGLRLARQLQGEVPDQADRDQPRPLRLPGHAAAVGRAGAARRQHRRGAAGRRERAGHGLVPRADQRRRGQHHGLPAGQAHGRAAGAGADQPQGLRRPGAGHHDRHRHVAGARGHRRVAGLCAPGRRGGGAFSLRRGAAEALEAVVRGDRGSCRMAGRRIEEVGLPRRRPDRRHRARPGTRATATAWPWATSAAMPPRRSSSPTTTP